MVANDAEDINNYLTAEKLGLGEVDKVETATAKAQEVIAGITELKDKVTLAAPKDGKIHVTVNKDVEELIGEADFTFSIKNV